MEYLPALLAVLVLAACSAFLSASETALFALSRAHLAALRGSSAFASQVILRLRERPAAVLSTILLFNTAVNILLYSIIAVTTARVAVGSAVASTVLGVVSVAGTLLFAEILPKLVAFVNCERLAPLVAPPLRFLQVVSTPVRWLIDRAIVHPLTRIVSPGGSGDSAIQTDELGHLISAARAGGLIDQRENAMLQQVMRLADARVSSLMLPRVDVVAFDLAGDAAELARLIRQHRLLRIPVYEGDIDQVRGVIHSRDFLLNPAQPLRGLVQPVPFIPEQASVEALLQHFRTTGTQLALVVDEYGGMAGLVALEDIVEEIVGDLRAPGEQAPGVPIRRVDSKNYLIDAGLSLDEFRRAFDLPIEESRVNTVGGLVTQTLDRLPQSGDVVSLGDARLEVVAMRRRRVLSVRLTLAQPPRSDTELARLLADPAAGAASPATGAGGSVDE